MEQHPDWERVLKKNLTQNTMRNLEKILEAIKSGGGVADGRWTSGRSAAAARARRLRRRTAPSRKTL